MDALVTDSPENHGFISSSEKAYLKEETKSIALSSNQVIFLVSKNRTYKIREAFNRWLLKFYLSFIKATTYFKFIIPEQTSFIKSHLESIIEQSLLKILK